MEYIILYNWIYYIIADLFMCHNKCYFFFTNYQKIYITNKMDLKMEFNKRIIEIIFLKLFIFTITRI